MVGGFCQEVGLNAVEGLSSESGTEVDALGYTEQCAELGLMLTPEEVLGLCR